MPQNISFVFEKMKTIRKQINDLTKQKQLFAQKEYEELQEEAKRIKQKYLQLNDEVNADIKYLNEQYSQFQDELFLGGFIDIGKFANDVANLLSASTGVVWEINAIAFNYKKRTRKEGKFELVPTDANLVAVAKKDAFSQELLQYIFSTKNWLNNNQALMGFMELVKRGDIVLLHIVEQDNKTEKTFNLFEYGFNSDFDKYLLRFETEYNDKNPIHRFPQLNDYLDKYIMEQLSKK